MAGSKLAESLSEFKDWAEAETNAPEDRTNGVKNVANAETEESWTAKQQASMQQHNGMNIAAEVACALAGEFPQHAKQIELGAAAQAQENEYAEYSINDVFVFKATGDQEVTKEKPEPYTTPEQFSALSPPGGFPISINWTVGQFTKSYMVKAEQPLQDLFHDFKQSSLCRDGTLVFFFNSQCLSEDFDTVKSASLSSGSMIYAWKKVEEVEPTDNLKETEEEQQAGQTEERDDKVDEADSAKEEDLQDEEDPEGETETETEDDEDDEAYSGESESDVEAPSRFNIRVVWDEPFETKVQVRIIVGPKTEVKYILKAFTDRQDKSTDPSTFSFYLDRKNLKGLDSAATCDDIGLEPNDVIMAFYDEPSQSSSYYEDSDSDTESVGERVKATTTPAVPKTGKTTTAQGKVPEATDQDVKDNKVELNLRWTIKHTEESNILKCYLAPNVKLLKIVQQLKERLKKTDHNFILAYRGKIITKDDTVGSLALDNGVTITAFGVPPKKKGVRPLTKKTKPAAKKTKPVAKKTKPAAKKTKPAPKFKKPVTRGAAKKSVTRRGAANNKRAAGGERLAGDRPVTIRQMVDAPVRSQIIRMQGGVQMAQQMSTPYARSDLFDPDECDDEDILAQREWPWQIHSPLRYTEQVPNRNGQNKQGEVFLDTPELHLMVGSQQAGDKIKEVLREVTTCKVIVHTAFDAYADAASSTEVPHKRGRVTRAVRDAANFKKQKTA